MFKSSKKLNFSITSLFDCIVSISESLKKMNESEKNTLLTNFPKIESIETHYMSDTHGLVYTTDGFRLNVSKNYYEDKKTDYSIFCFYVDDEGNQKALYPIGKTDREITSKTMFWYRYEFAPYLNGLVNDLERLKFEIAEYKRNRRNQLNRKSKVKNQKIIEENKEIAKKFSSYN